MDNRTNIIDAFQFTIVQLLNGNRADPMLLNRVFRDFHLVAAIIEGLTQGIIEYNESLEDLNVEEPEPGIDAGFLDYDGA